MRWVFSFNGTIWSWDHCGVRHGSIKTISNLERIFRRFGLWFSRLVIVVLFEYKIV